MEHPSNQKQWLGTLLSYFMSVKTIDDNIESLRIALCSPNDFYPNQLFQYLDFNNKDFISLNDFSNYLKEMKIPFEEKYLRKFIHNFDKDNDFCLNFKEFLGLIIPKKNIDIKNKVLKKKNSPYMSDRMNKTTKNIFGKLLCEEIELVKNCIKTAQFCRGTKGFTSYESFIEIAGNERYITENYLYNFLQKNNIDINNNDMHQLMFRVDADDDGKISFNEFEEIFFPMKETELSYKNNYFKEKENNDYNFYIKSSINGKESLKEIPNKIYKNNNIDFTFSQNYLDFYQKQNIKENNSDANTEYNDLCQILNDKKYNLSFGNKNTNIEKEVNPKNDKKYIYSKTEKIIGVLGEIPPETKESKNQKDIDNNNNINNIKISNISNKTILSTTFNKTSIYKNNNYDSSIFQSSNLRKNNLTYESPKIKHTNSPLFYDYSTYSDEDGDEYFRQKKLRQSAKTENDRNYRIFKDDNKKIQNIKFIKKNTIKPCCACPIFDTICPCPVNAKSIEKCKCPKNINNIYGHNPSFRRNITDETKNNSFNKSLNNKFFKSKSQFNFFYDNSNENIINERKFDEKRLFGYKRNKL